MHRQESRGLAEQLLGGNHPTTLARSILQRSMLAGGRFEAHEFGRNQHSSASAGGLLIGLSAIRALSDDDIASAVRAVLGLIQPNGRVRGHDADAAAGDTSWAESQILLGLLSRPHLIADDPIGVCSLVDRLISLQHPSGGWPLRAGEEPSVTFAFYSVLALSLVSQRNIGNAKPIDALRMAGTYLQTVLDSDSPNLTERVLALYAYERLLRTPVAATLTPRREYRREVLEQCWNASGGLQLRDQVIAIYSQPVWHSITWRPLLYLCFRKWVTPLEPVAASLAQELIDTFNPAVRAWPGPIGAVTLGTGVSWASALALRAVVALGRDLERIGATMEDFTRRLGQLNVTTYKFDIAISFAGADRAIAETICRRIQAAGLRVFYDRDHQHALLGEDLADQLQRTYLDDSRFAIVVVSRAFLNSRWAGNWEWRAVLARMQRQRAGYVLPYVVEETDLPGLNPTLGYVSAQDYSAVEFAELVVRKVRSQVH